MHLPSHHRDAVSDSDRRSFLQQHRVPGQRRKHSASPQGITLDLISSTTSLTQYISNVYMQEAIDNHFLYEELPILLLPKPRVQAQATRQRPLQGRHHSVDPLHSPDYLYLPNHLLVHSCHLVLLFLPYHLVRPARLVLDALHLRFAWRIELPGIGMLALASSRSEWLLVSCGVERYVACS